jgi:hypothetical protein
LRPNSALLLCDDPRMAGKFASSLLRHSWI